MSNGDMSNSHFHNPNLISSFHFGLKYTGVVIDNSEFDEQQKIKVFIPELFGKMHNSNNKEI